MARTVTRPYTQGDSEGQTKLRERRHNGFLAALRRAKSIVYSGFSHRYHR